MTKKPTLGAVLTVKNEEHRILRKHLENLREFCDEIAITVDTSTTDNTFAICKEYTDKVTYIDEGDYSTAVRKKAADLLETDWELWVDADFVFPTKTQEEIRLAIMDPSALCFELPVCSFMFGKWFMVPRHWFHQLRLIKRGFIHYERVDMHAWKFSNLEPPRQITNPTLHYGVPDIEGFIQSMNRYTSIDSQQIVDTGTGGAFNHFKCDFSTGSLSKLPMLVFDTYYNNYGFHEEEHHGVIYSWLFAFYAFLEKAKVYELEYKQGSQWVYGKFDADKVLEEIGRNYPRRTKGFTSHKYYNVNRIIKGLMPPYLYKFIQNTFKRGN